MELNLSENQIYKWFWDTKKKLDDDNMAAYEIGSMVSGKMSNGKLLLQGSNGAGESLTPAQIKTALKLN